MKVFKKIFKVFLLAVFAFSLVTQPLKAVTNDLTVHFFWGIGCPHCEKEDEFLQTLEKKYPNVIFEKYEIYYNEENQQKMLDMGQELSIDAPGVPFIIIGEEYFVGFLNAETTGKRIENAIINYLETNGEKKVEDKRTPSANIDTSEVEPLELESGKKISLPIWGEIDTKDFSLPLLTVIIALIDGFNPCAMWTLFFLIGLLLGMKDRKRMWILGIAFIVSSAFVYFLFLSAWLNLFLFLGFIFWVRVIIGLLALGAGIYYLKEFFVNKDATCKVSESSKKQKVFDKMKEITQKKQLFLAIFGIILLALAVNMVELICSAGLPAIYTQTLSLSNLSNFKHYSYLLLYVFIFMIDDLFVFVTAMITLKAVGLHTKYSRFSHLVGGILILIIGLLLLFKPEILMFG